MRGSLVRAATLAMILAGIAAAEPSTPQVRETATVLCCEAEGGPTSMELAIGTGLIALGGLIRSWKIALKPRKRAPGVESLCENRS